MRLVHHEKCSCQSTRIGCDLYTRAVCTRAKGYRVREKDITDHYHFILSWPKSAQNACPCIICGGILPALALGPRASSSKSGFDCNSISRCCCACCCCCPDLRLGGTPRFVCPRYASGPGFQFGFMPRWLIDVILLLSLAGLRCPSWIDS